MSNPTDVVARAFAKAMNDQAASRCGDDAGKPLAVQVPLAAGGNASLAFNATTGRWILTLEHRVDHVSEEALDEHLEMLITQTNMVRFSFGMVAGLNGNGEVSLSIPVSGSPDAREVQIMLDRMLELSRTQPEEPREVAGPLAEEDPLEWVRV